MGREGDRVLWMFMFWVAVGALLLLAGYACVREVAAAELPCGPATSGLRVRFQAPLDQGAGVTGYRLYTAALSEQYTTPIELSLPTAEAGGLLIAQVPESLSTRTAFYAVMTAYGPGGESINHSREVLVPATTSGDCRPPGAPTLLEITVDLTTGSVEHRLVPQP